VKRADIEEDIKKYHQYQVDVLNEIEELVSQLAF